jgi:hypothetical protein
MSATVVPHQRARVEGAQIEIAEVNESPEFGIPGKEDLKATVEQEAVDLVGTHAAADVVLSLEYRNAKAGTLNFDCGTESGKAGADDYRVEAFGHECLLSSARSASSSVAWAKT